jgi:glycerol-3-phosphate dehydrogenase subunit B
VTGIRLREALVQRLSQLGVRGLYQMKVLQARTRKGTFLLDIGRGAAELKVKAGAVVLASGRFIGQGLVGGRSKIRETIFNLPVHQPASRKGWHRLDFFDPQGHAVNRCGVLVDAAFRPLRKNGRIFHPSLFAAGSVLAHADWIRMKCGSGLAIASAYAAVNACMGHRT